VNKWYGNNHVVKDLDLEVTEGEFLTLLGPSGCGKTTTLRMIAGFEDASSGRIEVQGESVEEKEPYQRDVNTVFQSYSLFPHMNVFDNIMTGALVVQRNTPELVERVKTLLKQVGISEDMWKKYPNQLSGGECQRVGIVRAVINNPKILFADEPTGALNSSSGQDVLDVFSGLHKNGQSIVMVTHDIKTALRGSRVIYLRDGGIVGEHRMPDFGADDVKERRSGLQDFLDEMGW
jgi:putative ABC transport system ATP-binding protein